MKKLQEEKKGVMLSSLPPLTQRLRCEKEKAGRISPPWEHGKEVMPMARYLADILVAVAAGVLVVLIVRLFRLDK